jgi:hypothetical protein
VRHPIFNGLRPMNSTDREKTALLMLNAFGLALLMITAVYAR